MQRIINLLAIVLLLLFIGMMGWLGYLLFDDDVDSNFKMAVLTAIGAVGATLSTHWLAKKREIEARHFDKKRECYEALLGTVARMLTPEHAGKKLTDRQLMQAILKHRREIAIWGDADLINWWLRLTEPPGGKLSTPEALTLGEDLIRNIRKELGWDDSAIERGHLISLFLKEPLEEVVRQVAS